MESISIKVVNDNQKSQQDKPVRRIIKWSQDIFQGETEGQRALLGLHADIITVDEFIMPQESEE